MPPRASNASMASTLMGLARPNRTALRLPVATSRHTALEPTRFVLTLFKRA